MNYNNLGKLILERGKQARKNYDKKIASDRKESRNGKIILIVFLLSSLVFYLFFPHMFFISGAVVFGVLEIILFFSLFQDMDVMVGVGIFAFLINSLIFSFFLFMCFIR